MLTEVSRLQLVLRTEWPGKRLKSFPDYRETEEIRERRLGRKRTLNIGNLCELQNRRWW